MSVEGSDGPLNDPEFIGGIQFVPLERTGVEDDIASRRARHEAEIDLALLEVLGSDTYLELGALGLSTEIDPDDGNEDDQNKGGGNGGRGVPPRPRPSIFPSAASVELPLPEEEKVFSFSGSGPRPILH